MNTKHDPALSDLRYSILSCASTLLKLIDSYTAIMKEKTGKDQTTVSAFRGDAQTLVRAAFQEIVNPDDEEMTEQDYEAVSQIMCSLGIDAK